jgi:hypothetical protein
LSFAGAPKRGGEFISPDGLVTFKVEATKMADKTKTGWERENRTRFDDIVVNYDKVR